MGHYEKLWLNNHTGPKVLYYSRYVDDIICCFRNSNDARLFLCGLHEVYSHIMVSPDLFIYLFMYLFICLRESSVCHVVYRSSLGCKLGFEFEFVIVSRVSSPCTSQQIQTQLVL